MSTIKHKFRGTARVIGRDGDRVRIKYDRDGSESELLIPDSFMLGVFVEIDEELQREVDLAVEANKEAERIKREEKDAEWALAQAQASTKNAGSGTKRSGKTFITIKRTGDVEKDFEHFLKINGYSEETHSQTKSTIYSYLNSVRSIMKDEGLDWDSLVMEISNVVRLYDVGGDKEEVGYKGKSTVINALRRFEDFVNNSTP